MAKLRAVFVRNAFDFAARAADDKARPDLCEALDVDDPTVLAIAEQLARDPAFARLNEVRGAMAPCQRQA